MSTRGTCKFYNGDYHNQCCEAGVRYRDVTTDPDVIEASAFRKPCIDWDEWNRQHGKDFDNELQRTAWERRGYCSKREEPSDEEIAATEAEIKRRTAEFVNDINEGRCPHCRQRVTQRQVGHCVYGSCGHRMYQGKVNPRFAEHRIHSARKVQ